MRVAAAAALAALLLSLGGAAAAEGRTVVVIDARSSAVEPWPAGERAVVAELAASDDQVVVRASDAATTDALLDELEQAANGAEMAGAVAVVRSGNTGIAYVWLSGGSSVIRVEDDVRQGIVAEGAVALRVSELLHVRTFKLPEREPPPPTPPREAPRPPPEPAQAAPGPIAWLGAGLLASSGASGPSAALSLGARVPVVQPFAVEPSAAVSLGGLGVTTEAGTADVDLQALGVHAMVDPWAARPLGVAFGLGGGLAWFSELARPEPGFAGASDSTMVGHVSARVAGSFRGDRIGVVAFLEPGVMIPAVTIRADDRELAELGRPYVLAALGLGLLP